MADTLVVVADSGRARIFSLRAGLNLYQSLVHAEGRIRNPDEVSDRLGGIAVGHGEGDHTLFNRGSIELGER